MTNTLNSALQQAYTQSMKDALKKKLNIDNPHAVPMLKAIHINMSSGSMVGNKKLVAETVEDLMAIAGQKPVVTTARKSNANFKIREGWPIGAKVTLHGQNMYLFLEKLLYVVLPRVRDFRGLSHKSFDGRGNYSLGLHEHTVFPEIPFEKVTERRGLDINFVTSTDNDDHAKALLTALGFPFTKERTQ